VGPRTILPIALFLLPILLFCQTLKFIFFRIKRKHITLGLGLHDVRKTDSGLILPAAKLILHEDFHSDALHDFNDIALIKLPQSVEFTENIKPVCLPIPGKYFLINQIIPLTAFRIIHIKSRVKTSESLEPAVYQYYY
jgi:hypothetical protein